MSKAIEELAKQYAEDMYPAEDYIDSVLDNERNNDMAICIGEAKSVLGWLFNEPLASRLTETEKEMVREDYSDNKCLIESASLSYVQREVFSKINEVLEHIFGKEFFKEDKL